MILFLDYDGVLHPDPLHDRQRLFEHKDRLAETLAEFPEVSIVLSTSWRTSHAREQLLAPLGDLQARVVGVTPLFSSFSAPAALVPYRREAECLRWLQEQRLSDAPWVALDDRPSWFRPYCDNLIACDARSGFDATAAAHLRSALLRARHRSAQQVDALL